MMTAAHLADLAPWHIYLYNQHWPSGPDMIFLPSLVSDAMWTRHGIPGCHAVDEDETRTYRDFIAADIATLIMEGSLALTCTPVQGGGSRKLTKLDLSTQIVQAAIATGIITLGEKTRRTMYWVFCGAPEARLLLPILEHEAGDGDGSALLKRLLPVVRGNLSMLSGNAPLAQSESEAGRITSLLLPTLNRTLGPDDRAKLVDAGATWLKEKFDEEKDGGLLKEGYRNLALSQFAPFMTKRIFNDMWAKAATYDRRCPGRRPSSQT